VPSGTYGYSYLMVTDRRSLRHADRRRLSPVDGGRISGIGDYGNETTWIYWKSARRDLRIRGLAPELPTSFW
jgi:hypothetical protein